MTDNQRLNKATFILKALSHPIRQRLLLQFHQQTTLTIPMLEARLNVKPAELTHHIRYLENTGLLTRRRQGPSFAYVLTDPAVATCLTRLLKNL